VSEAEGIDDRPLGGVQPYRDPVFGQGVRGSAEIEGLRGQRRASGSGRYPRRFVSPSATEYVLLEMGSRGGPTPRQPHLARSQVANYAIEVLGEMADEWAEFASVAIDVLSPERTLLEKLALLHDCGTRYA
jgi:hypothetical protein